MRPPIVVRAGDKSDPVLLCACAALLPIRKTAYGAMAICPTCNVRWTAIREDERAQMIWEAETR